jgi:hypothetical protein
MKITVFGYRASCSPQEVKPSREMYCIHDAAYSASCLFGSLFYPEDRDSMLPRNFGELSPDYTASHSIFIVTAVITSNDI